MRATVLKDPALLKRAGRFVWLEIDTEKPGNAPFLVKFPVEVWPTFLVVDPATEKPALKWLGSAKAADLVKLLEDGERAVRGADGESAEAILARADRANAEGRTAEAAAGYRAALARGGDGWPRRPRAVESLVALLQSSGDREGCAAAAREESPRLPRGPSFANAVVGGLGCALSAPEEAPWRPGAVAALEPLAAQAVKLPGLLADDRAAIYEALVEARQSAKDAAGARRVAEAWWRFLGAEGRRAASADERAALDSARVGAAMALDDPARAVPALEASERDLPGDYNPPARLAFLYRALGSYDEALAASERALARAYGPRKLRVFDLRASIQKAKGDAAGERATLRDAVAWAAALPEPQRPAELVDRMKQRLGEIDGGRE